MSPDGTSTRWPRLEVDLLQLRQLETQRAQLLVAIAQVCLQPHGSAPRCIALRLR